MQTLAQNISLAASPALAACHALHLPAQQAPWTPSGIHLRKGQSCTLLADGVVHWSERHPHLHGGPGFHLWARVHPGGRIVNLIRNSTSFVADVDGELELGIYLGMWRDAYGTLDTPATAYGRLRGGLDVLVLVWRGNSLVGLEDIHSRCASTLLAAEIERLRNPVPVPPDWHYLIETGTSDIYRDCSEGGQARICLHADDDQGILRKAVDFPLTPNTRLRWRWRLDAHPSRVAENSNATHDYVSIATEFDNGRDLTWIWSSTLPVETWFDCPIRIWSGRETHYVVRSGLDAAAQWCDEQRPVYDDVARSMGAPPARIVAVWLICVASFQHGTARAAFEKIELSDGERRVSVL